MKTVWSALGVIAVALLAGCAETPVADEAFGDSVRSMVRAQTHDPLAAASPAREAPQEGDGQRIDNAIKAHRGDVSKGTTDVKQDLEIRVGR